MMETTPRLFIYTSPILKNMYTIQPMAKFTYSTYVLLDAIKQVMSEEEFNELRIKLRGCKIKQIGDDKNKI